MNSGTLLVAIIGLALAALILSSIMKSVRIAKKIKTRIDETWGKEPEKAKPEKLKTIAVYYNDKVELEPGLHRIDSITWNDLDMDRVFMRINNTGSTIGEEYLYCLLREPLFDKDLLMERSRMADFFLNNSVQRKKLQYILAELGKVDTINVSNTFLGRTQEPAGKALFYNLLGAAALLSPILMVFNLPLGLMIFIFVFAVNMTLYYKGKNELGAQLESLSYTVRLISSAKKIIDADIPELRAYTLRLASSYKNLKSINKKSFSILYTNGDPLIEYIKIISLRELANYESITRLLYLHREDLQIIYETVGLLDSLIAVASYRKSTSWWCIPDFCSKDGNSGKSLLFKEACHPLIKEPVANSLCVNKSILITGSNASGKSTFIKTVAINALLAQTITTCLAKEYSSSFFKIFSSMALRDDIVNNESYYIAEIKSLKRIFDQLEEDTSCLCLIDEVLRGTNTVERIAASSQVLFSLSQNNCLCVAATHDIELTRILEGHFINYHFQEQITEKGIDFDYQLYEGRSHTRNAIKLLKFMGYDESIVSSAEARAQDFLSGGKWNPIEARGPL